MEENGAETFVQHNEAAKEWLEKKQKPNYLFVVLFYFLGTVCYVPHNIYVTANEYWMYKFRDPDSPFNQSDTTEKTSLQANFTAYVHVANNVGMTVFLVVTTLFLAKRISLQKRIVGSMTVMLLLFVLTLLLIYVNTDSWQPGFYGISLAIAALLSSCSAVLILSLYHLASEFSSRCLAAMFAGQSMCGILAAVVQIIALLAAPSVKSTAALYYTIATMVIFGVMCSYILVSNRSTEFRENIRTLLHKKDEVEKNQHKFKLTVMKTVFWKLRFLLIALALGAGVSNILNPGFTALIEPAAKGTNEWTDVYFIPVCVFLLYNTVEFAAREISNYVKELRNIYIVFITSILRVPLIPLILLCNLKPRTLPVVFFNDVYFIIFVILLAASGGYVINITLLSYTDYCEPDEKEMGKLALIIVLVVFMPIFSLLSGVFVGLL